MTAVKQFAHIFNRQELIFNNKVLSFLELIVRPVGQEKGVLHEREVHPRTGSSSDYSVLSGNGMAEHCYRTVEVILGKRGPGETPIGEAYKLTRGSLS